MGFDISAKQFPSKEVPKIKFVVYDVFQPFPQEYQGKFDLVNVRLLTYALTSDSIQTAVENVAQLLATWWLRPMGRNRHHRGVEDDRDARSAQSCAIYPEGKA